MDVLSFTAKQDTPEITLDKGKGILKISGNSFSEDPFTIYERVFSWLKEYGTNPNEKTNFQFELNYVNTASSKQIVEILKVLENIKDKTNVEVSWVYQDGDDDMFSEGDELSKMFDIPFSLIQV